MQGRDKALLISLSPSLCLRMGHAFGGGRVLEMEEMNPIWVTKPYRECWETALWFLLEIPVKYLRMKFYRVGDLGLNLFVYMVYMLHMGIFIYNIFTYI